MTHRIAPDGTWIKSSYSTETGNNCVAAAWFKSSYSSENGGTCVEVADLTGSGRVAIRDSGCR